jgi:nucleotide-binding universal stress UspA family protein
MKTILIPTDFSDVAHNALQVAVAIARQNNATIHLLHVMDASMGGGFSATGEIQDYSGDNFYLLKLMEVNKKKLYALANELQNSGVPEVHCDIQVGNIADVVTRQTGVKGIDLIVMGTEGASGLNELLIGSNTEKIVRLSRVPVLSVKGIEAPFAVKKIVYASDFLSDQVTAVNSVKRLSTLFGAKIHLVYVNVPNRFTSTRVIARRKEAFTQQYQLTDADFTIYNDELEERGIIHFAEEVQADLIAVATHGRTGIAHLLSGSIAENIVNHATRPVLTINLKGLPV